MRVYLYLQAGLEANIQVQAATFTPASRSSNMTDDDRAVMQHAPRSSANEKTRGKAQQILVQKNYMLH